MKKYFEKFDHTCDLEDEEEPDESQERFERLRKLIIKWATIDPLSNLTMQHFNTYSNIKHEMKRHLQRHPMIIHPFSRIKCFWEGVMTFVLLAGLITSPLEFLVYTDRAKESFVGRFTLLRIVKTVCIVDMISRFFTGYWDEENFVVSFYLLQHIYGNTLHHPSIRSLSVF